MLAVLLLTHVAAWSVVPLNAATRYDPRLRFRALSTPRFTIYYHQGEDALARRLARVAEDVADQLAPRLGRPTRRVHLILVDQSDLSNGWATPIPHNTIEIATASPRGASIIGNTNDWLRLVFTHEYTHILHLDRSRGLFGGLRKAFGRHPAVYPNLFLPLWQIEGIATYEESTLTGRGRLPSGDFREILSAAAHARRFAALDRASTLQVDWPAGHTPYVYGGYFHRYLAERFGAAALGRLSDATARRVPYFGARAFRTVFGRDLGGLWEDFEAAARSMAPAATSASTRLTRHGFSVLAPRFADDGRLFYSVANPHGFPALLERSPGADAPREVATRYPGNRISIAGTMLVFDQLDLVRSVGLQSDLYVLALETARYRRITREARAADPDVARDGRTIVCTVQLTDRRALATLTLPAAGEVAVPQLLVSEPLTDFASPRWSPDGRTIAAERRRLGGPSEIVLIDVDSAQPRSLLSFQTARAVDPVWTPDGRTLLFAADFAESFRLFAVDVATGQVRRMPGIEHDAKAPDVSPDGRSLVYVGYSPDGYDLFSAPFELDTWIPASESIAERRTPEPGQRPDDQPGGVAGSTARPYRPWATLLPQYWTPVIESDGGETAAGAATSGIDVLGRHAWFASAAWSRSRARPDWTAAYVFDRWRPSLFADISDDTDPALDGDVRTREAEAGFVLPFSRVRWSQALFASFHGSTDEFHCTGCPARLDRRSVRAGWRFAGSRTYGYSISREEGADVGLTIEVTRRGLGADGDAAAATWDARQYVRLRPRHAVVAARAAAATAWGDALVRRRFSAAGADPVPAGFSFGSDAIGLLRGFAEADVAGSHAAVVNLDYRLPLVRIDRGAGTWPLFLRVAHAAVFADAGHAWDGAFSSSDVRASIGAELSLDTVIGYAVPVTLSTGVAWRVHGPRDQRGVVAFGRIGRAF